MLEFSFAEFARLMGRFDLTEREAEMCLGQQRGFSCLPRYGRLDDG